MLDRFLEAPVAQAIDDAAPALELPFAQMSSVLDVDFTSTSVADIAHGMSAVPDGVMVLLQVGGTVTAANLTGWDRSRAYLQASAANTRALVVFVTFKEGAVIRA